MTEASYREKFNAAAEGDLRGLTGEVGCLTIGDYILRRAAPPNAARSLDLGCGDGGVLKAIARLRPDLECVGVDFADGSASNEPWWTSRRR